MDLVLILNGTLVIKRLERWLKDKDGDWVGFSSQEHVATFSALAILLTATNGPLDHVLLGPKPWRETFIDWLIITDYILCIPNIDCRDDADVCLEVRDAGGNTGLPLLTHHAHRLLTRHGGQQARRR